MRADDEPSAIRSSALAALLIVVVATFAGWGVFNRTIEPPPMEGQLYGVTYAPYGKDQDAMAFGNAGERIGLIERRRAGLAELERTAPSEEKRAAAARERAELADDAAALAARRQHAPRPEQIERDMRTLAGRVRYVRTYSALDGIEAVPKIADQYGLKVVAGAWVYDHVGVMDDQKGLLPFYRDLTAREIAALIRIANINPNVERVLVGNETLLRGEIRTRRLAEYVRQVKKNVKVPVSTAEPFHVWLDEDGQYGIADLVKEVDFIAVHILPYWDKGAGKNGDMAYLKDKIEELRKAYPNKNIVVTEVGWPSHGAGRIGRDKGGQAIKVASQAEQARHIREAVAWLREQKIDHFVIEAFDQPWKSRDLEGLAGGYWGLWDADRQLKFDWTAPVTAFPVWWKLALWTLLLALPLFVLSLWLVRGMRFAGHLTFAAVAALSGAGMVYAGYVMAGTYMVWYQVLGWSLLMAFLMLSLAMVLAQALEMAETIWRRRWTRAVPPAADVLAALPAIRRWPKVSLHLAICNEPPAMVKETLDSLAALDYPNLEVIVIDNNTRDPAVWRPVEEHCRQIGERFRFFHFDVMKGFKAGALNHVLKETAPDAEIIGVIDSDYVVRKDWLKALVPQFDDPKIGYVQAPQDHRDWRDDRFKEMLQWEYAGFFDIGMCLRNEYDALIQHGTMTLIRRSVMDELGGWATWCITEDTEFGLRAMERGYSATYSRERFGQGLTPDNFSGYKKQRFRWAYGAMQILKGHWRSLLTNRTQLTFWQKYHFATGWLPWFADALNVVFTLAGLVWAFGALVPVVPPLAPLGEALTWLAGLVGAESLVANALSSMMGSRQWSTLPLPPEAFVVPTLALFVFKLVYSFALYGTRVGCTVRQSIGAAFAGLSLTYTVGKAVIYGLLTSKLPFIRTPKMDSRATLGRALAMARDEAAIAAALLVAAVGVWMQKGVEDPEARLWSVLLVVQSLPYLAAVHVSLINALEQMRQSQALVISPPAQQPVQAQAEATVPLAAGD
jgi:cellulose synthase/poly-beta-1,6-N-acetylglucosamine synthase-like glycosyltransferase/exo-beta-1,3-glucanase (GH17 family)